MNRTDFFTATPATRPTQATAATASNVRPTAALGGTPPSSFAAFTAPFAPSVGAGGAFISVPYMTSRQVPIHQAVGTSSALGFPIALAGTLVGGDPLRQRVKGRCAFFLRLEEGVLLQHLLQLLVEVQRRQLQQTNRLLQRRRERQVLGESNLQ